VFIVDLEFSEINVVMHCKLCDEPIFFIMETLVEIRERGKNVDYDGSSIQKISNCNRKIVESLLLVFLKPTVFDGVVPKTHLLLVYWLFHLMEWVWHLIQSLQLEVHLLLW